MASFKASLSFLLMFLVACYALDMSIIDSSELSGESNVRALFESWLAKHGKAYNAVGEKEKRFVIFKDNLKYIIEHNAQGHPYELGLTKFADLTDDEFNSIYGRGLRMDLAETSSKNISSRYAFQVGDDLPKFVDWRQKDAVTMVGDQGQCGSCWAWATAGAIEGIYKIMMGKLIPLSAQELVDCVSECLGCKGGWPSRALDWVVKNRGLDKEEDYFYWGRQQECDEFKMLFRRVAFIDGYERGPDNDEKSLQKAVAAQPVIVCVDTRDKSFRFYKKGIFMGHGCASRTQLTHAVIIVGYGTENGEDYWILKNSWRYDWGEDGYMRILRNSNRRQGACGIAMFHYYPTIKPFIPHSGRNEVNQNISSF